MGCFDALLQFLHHRFHLQQIDEIGGILAQQAQECAPLFDAEEVVEKTECADFIAVMFFFHFSIPGSRIGHQAGQYPTAQVYFIDGLDPFQRELLCPQCGC
jgi:hypothetical protein